MTQTKVYIYRMIDPSTGEPRYVGKAKNPKRRLMQHILETQKGNMTPCKAWVQSLLNDGKRPLMEIIEVCSDDDWRERERFQIALHRSKFPGLKNLADGGDEPFCSKSVRSSNAFILNKSSSAPINAILRVLGKAKRKAVDSGRGERAAHFAKVMDLVASSTGVLRDRYIEYGKKFTTARI